MAVEAVRQKISVLRDRLRTITPPDGLRCKSFNDRRVCEGFAFFPGGDGVWNGDRAAVTTIVLASDWGNEASFRRLITRRKYTDEATIRNGKPLLREAGYAIEECFFTNAWPVLRSDDMPESGHHAMRDAVRLTEQCRDFFTETVRLLEPKLVLTLGKSPAWFVARFVGSNWPAGAFKSADDVTFTLNDLGSDFVCSPSGVIYVPGTHWSRLNNMTTRWFPNVKRPADHYTAAREAEIELYRRAREAAGLEDRLHGVKGYRTA
jgi:uracil-DNA glycosylase